VHAAVALDLGERFYARQQVVADAADAAELIEVAVVIAGRAAVGEFLTGTTNVEASAASL